MGEKNPSSIEYTQPYIRPYSQLWLNARAERERFNFHAITEFRSHYGRIKSHRNGGGMDGGGNERGGEEEAEEEEEKEERASTCRHHFELIAKKRLARIRKWCQTHLLNEPYPISLIMLCIKSKMKRFLSGACHYKV